MTARPKQHQTIEPSGDLLAVTLKDGSEFLCTYTEAVELRRRGELAPAVADGLALTEDNVFGSEL